MDPKPYRSRRRIRRIGLPLLALGLLLILGLMAVAWFGSGQLVSPPRRELQSYHREILADPSRFGLSITSYTGPAGTPCVLVTPSPTAHGGTKSRQLRESLSKRGLDLPAWGEVRGTVVLLHGHTGRKEDHLPICERFCAAGFRCLIPDLPGHGDHPSSIATFGKNEAPLIEALFDDAVTTFSLPTQPALLFGVSQGGAIALQTAARDPDRWAGVAAAAAFASLDLPVRVSAENFHPYLRPLAPLNSLAVCCGAWCRGGIWPAAISPLEAAPRLELPVMIAHGENDHFIPIAQGRQIFSALPEGNHRFRLVEDADHNRVLAADAANFYPDLCAFFLAVISPPTR